LAESTSFKLADIALFKRQALEWAAQFPTVCLLDSNDYKLDRYSDVDWILAIDALDFVSDSSDSFDSLQKFIDTAGERVFGFLSYDLKNQVERLTSVHPDHIGFPLMYFFMPRYIIEIKDGKVHFNRNYPESFDLYERIMHVQPKDNISQAILLQSRTAKEKYIDNVQKIKEQIRVGDFYEINYCCEFFSENTLIDPVDIFYKLNSRAKAPMSAFFRLGERYLLCASPERFIKKTGTQIISQPIKGTIRKGQTAFENSELQAQLLASEKERAENVMIVDLVRNDLAKSAVTGSVIVEELFGIYEFPTVHQMISTVSAQIQEAIRVTDIIRSAFPMGSMTGAPKVEVMKNIELYEEQRRGLYSGSVGYITPEGDFDLNVVIRSIFYNHNTKKLSIQVGSAITYDASPESEYEELLLKARGLLEALGAEIN
jgi:para-aminobenzoate synthetase component 1